MEVYTFKQCSHCKIRQNINDFNKNKNHKDGLHNQCKKCRKQYQIKNKDKIHKKSIKYYKKNKDSIDKKQAIYNFKNRDRKIEQYLKKKLTVINHYTQGKNTCMWSDGCDINDSDMLSVDHINDDGAEHRRKIGKNTNIIEWLFKHDFPEGFQILCHNHNYKKELLRRRKKQSSLH